ncbi:4-alpha-glucanotransferase [Candidatus Woesearchaeota archaeon]|nr:MAG: 4-alpha-glucanotransferase [archaeon GW2011_AR4]MBS3129407.1 4-alpha-glucanotransferase [Candidatus Woesearchaeota archaeon]HIH38449.1 4-alpha-glucanotransferase [Candidatus Woesearchaeota archaeon]HIH48093.1 4-alpha-glucanotransferase [Candidatus Woesearchaeota archaeon]HIJ03462.1 4-alpha-glucanotransferase [Candidatus Woesearchaeota archaeon]
MSQMFERGAGVLVHYTSLPGPEGIGTFREGVSFVETLACQGAFRYYQVLPGHPTAGSDSPFGSSSAFALNPNLISLQSLCDSGDLTEEQLSAFLHEWEAYKRGHSGRSDQYMESGFLWARKLGFDSRDPSHNSASLRLAYDNFQRTPESDRQHQFEQFCAAAGWLDDYAVFMAAKETFGFENMWCEWPDRLRFREDGYQEDIPEERIKFYRYVQFVADEQQQAVKSIAERCGIALIGDLPMYPAYDSADVWSNPHLFQLDERRKMQYVAGVPPDDFNDDGQRWGNPLYKWGIFGSGHDHELLYQWWQQRFDREAQLADIIRIDHFRGFTAYGQVPADEPTAKNAKWIRGPGNEVFERVDLNGVRIIAENLGVITPPVERNLRRSGFPGMGVLQFATFSDPDNNYLPKNAPVNSVYYTGTHDNDTFMGWLGELSGKKEAQLHNFLSQSPFFGPNMQAIDLSLSSPAVLAIVPIQDILGRGTDARMNYPGIPGGWWRWRMTPAEMAAFIDDKTLEQIARAHRRA